MKTETKEFTVGIYTLGCKVNQYESEAIAELLSAEGFLIQNHTKKCDIYIINTCTVTSEGDRKAKQFIRRAISANPKAYILVTGCLAQSHPSSVEKIAGVDYICGSANKTSIKDAVKELISNGEKPTFPIVNVTGLDEAPFEKMSISRFYRTRAYVKIEDGCENKCAYCAIPAARGPVRSKKPEEVICEVKRLTENGCREIVLTGIETASYGKDLDGADLISLLKEIDKIPNIGRVRLGSLDPSIMREDFVKKLSELSSLAPHFHLSMQSGSDFVLAKMRRKYNTRIALKNIENIKKYIPHAMLTTDMIVGFPGESDEDFKNTLEFSRRANFLEMHVFTYSKREGTEAAAMPNQIPKQIKKERSAALIKLALEIKTNILNSVAQEKRIISVLFESHSKGFAFGHSPEFIPVAVESKHPLNSETRDVQIEDIRDGICYGKLV